MTPVLQALADVKRAVALNCNELELIDRALADFAIETWGGATRYPEYATARAKITAALQSIDIERRQARLHGR